MGSTPKRWVIQPLMPKLEKSDLRARLSPSSEPHSPDNIWSPRRDGGSAFSFDNVSVARVHSSVTVSAPNGDHAPRDVMVHAMQVAVSEEDSEDWQPSEPSTPSSSDSRMGFYSFVEDPTSPEAERNEAYMVSPERQAKLSTLKEKSSFKLQTYIEDRRPERLFEESNGDSRYLVDEDSVEGNRNENIDRIEIIRNQAPKKNPVQSALESLDLSNSPQDLVEGFSLWYSPVRATSSQNEAEPGTIDNQQIDFKAARKQFQMMECSKANPFQYSPQNLPQFSKLRTRSLPAGSSLYTKEDTINNNFKDEPTQNKSPWREHVEEPKLTVTVQEAPEDQIRRKSIDVLDSVERRDGYSNDGSLSDETSMSEMKTVSSVVNTSETPIEREIRIAREREEDLRRSRGIFRSDSTEMIEIKTKPILSQPLSPLKPIKAKETNRVSFLIQREMERKNRSQRPSEKWTRTDLDERKRTFESQLHEEPIRSVSVEEEWVAERPVLAEQKDVPDSQETLSPCCPHRHKDEAMVQRTPTVDSVLKVENQPSWITAFKAKESRRVTSPINSPSSSVEPVRSSKSTVARKSNWESTVEWPRLQSASDIIRKEIEEDLRREQELHELRETSSLSLTPEKEKSTYRETTPTEPIANNSHQMSLNSSQENLVQVDVVPQERPTPGSSYSFSYSWSEEIKPPRVSSAGHSSRLPSVSIMTAQPWGSTKPASPAVPRAIPTFFTSPRPEASPVPSTPLTPTHKGLTETLLGDFEERRIRLKLEESAYAGIQPIDDINNEVVEATRVIRHKNTRALRWEAHEYANEEEN